MAIVDCETVRATTHVACEADISFELAPSDGLHVTSIERSEGNADCIETVRERLCRLAVATSDRNWDQEGAAAISRPLWQAAWDLAQIAMLDVPPSIAGKPHVSPCGDGSIHLAWRGMSGRGFLVEVHADGSFVWESHVDGRELTVGKSLDSAKAREALKAHILEH